jgi:opacity protein-like surface antigen
MKTMIAACLSLFVCSGTLIADELEESSEYNSSLSFLNEERIALDSSGGWYFTPHVGMNIISDTGTQGFTVNFSNGLAFGGGFGIELEQDLAFQFDFGYIRNDVDRITNDGTGIASVPDIEFTQVPLMFNLIFSPSNQPDMKPYFGLGLGAIRGKYESNAFINSDAEWALAGRVQVGVKVDLSYSSTLSIGYQFTLAQYDDNIDNHTVGLGFQFSF